MLVRFFVLMAIKYSRMQSIFKTFMNAVVLWRDSVSVRIF